MKNTDPWTPTRKGDPADFPTRTMWILEGRPNVEWYPGDSMWHRSATARAFWRSQEPPGVHCIHLDWDERRGEQGPFCANRPMPDGRLCADHDRLGELEIERERHAQQLAEAKEALFARRRRRTPEEWISFVDALALRRRSGESAASLATWAGVGTARIYALLHEHGYRSNGHAYSDSSLSRVRRRRRASLTLPVRATDLLELTTADFVRLSYAAKVIAAYNHPNNPIKENLT